MSTVVTKIEAAMRQLDVAIWLFFHDADPLSVRTLAGASTTILADLIETKTEKGSWRSHVIEDSGLPRARVISILNETTNFLKHADRDPDATLLFNEEENDDLLFIGVLECGELHPTSLHMQVFQIWYMAAYPGRFGPEVPQIPLAQRVFPGLDKVPRLDRVARGKAFLLNVERHGVEALSAA